MHIEELVYYTGVRDKCTALWGNIDQKTAANQHKNVKNFGHLPGKRADHSPTPTANLWDRDLFASKLLEKLDPETLLCKVSMAGRAGFEPATFGSGGRRPIPTRPPARASRYSRPGFKNLTGALKCSQNLFILPERNVYGGRYNGTSRIQAHGGGH